MATAYHMEALRKQRIIERKQEAACRLAAKQQGIPVSEISGTNMATHGGSPQDLMNVMSDHRQSENHRPDSKTDRLEDCLYMGEITHDPEFNYRLRSDKKDAPVHVNAIYRIMYPNTQTGSK